MDILELLKSRRSYRKFDATKLISDEIIQDILKAQQYAASAKNLQPLRYIAVKNQELVKEVFDITRWAGYLSYDEGQPKDSERPTFFIAVLMDKKQMGHFTSTDAGIAIDCMTLAAYEHNVGSCIIGNVKHDKLREILEISDELEIHSVVGFGYPTHKSEIKEVSLGESIKYYMEDDNTYIVPKLKIEDIVEYK